MAPAKPSVHDRPGIDTRLTGAIKSAIGTETAPIAPPGQRRQPADGKASPQLRAGFALAGAVLLALWGASLIPAIAATRDPRGDAFDLLPAFWATLTLLPIGLVALAGGISGAGQPMRRARNALTIGAGLLVLVLALEIFRRLSEALID